MYEEEAAEINALSNLSTSLSDGMTTLSAQNLAKPIAAFEEDLPANLKEVDGFVERFLAWQRGRVTGKANAMMWGSDAAKEDARLYVTRKVWVKKAQHDTIINPVAKTFVVASEIFKKMRGSLHEAVNQGAKHNQDVKLLVNEIRDEVDAVIVTRINDAMQIIAGSATKRIEEVQREQRKAMEHKK